MLGALQRRHKGLGRSDGPEVGIKVDSVCEMTKICGGRKDITVTRAKHMLSEFLIIVLQLVLKILHSPSGSQMSYRNACACQVPAAAMPACLLLAFIWVVCFFVCSTSS